MSQDSFEGDPSAEKPLTRSSDLLPRRFPPTILNKHSPGLTRRLYSHLPSLILEDPPVPTRFSRWLFLLAATALFASTAHADLYNKTTGPADTVALPKPADIQSLAVYPTQLTIKGLDDAAQLVVTA